MPTATLNRQLQLELCRVVEGRDDQLRTVHLHPGGSRNIGGSHLTSTLLAQIRGNRLLPLPRKNEVPYVQDDLLHAGDRRKLVQNTVNSDARHGGTGDGREQGPAKRVSEGVTKTGLERFDDELRAELGDVLFGERGALCDEHW